MKFLIKSTLFCILAVFFTLNSYASDCSHEDESFYCVDYVRTYDGDTFFVDIPGVHSFFGSEISVRIRGIDTGEVKDHPGRTKCEVEMAHRAKNELVKILENSSDIELRDIGRGKYFRVLADVYVNGRSVAKHLIKKHLAFEYDGGNRGGSDWCKLKRKADKSLSSKFLVK